MTKVDPVTGSLGVSLEKFDRQGLGPKTKLYGRILDPSGKPVVGAKIEPEGVQRGTGTSWGGLEGIDPLAITDENGEFLITSKQPFDALNVIIEARGFAKVRKNGLICDRAHQVALAPGVTVTGRVRHNDKPLNDVAIGMAGANRLAGEFVGSFEMGTDAEGRFTFLNLPPDTEYFIYGIMNSLKDHGAIPAKRIRVGRDGATTDVGELAVVPALKLAGKIVLSDGTQVPEHTRVTIGFDDAWDVQYSEADEEGRFELRGIPPKSSLSVSTRVKGYRFSGRNASLDPWNPFHLTGRIEKDKIDLIVLLDPGADLRPGRWNNMSPDDHPKNQPLRGAEAPTDLSDQLVISGKVIDAETQQPIPHFQITPGRPENRPPNRGTNWETHRVAEHTNGVFSLVLPKRAGSTLLMVEADGFLPAVSPPFSSGETNYTFKLKKGHGPEGTVLLPTGEAAAGVSVFRFGPGEQSSLHTNGQIQAYGTRDTAALTDPDGRFSFPPRLENCKVFISADHGFAEAETERLASNPKITLQAWGKIIGRLTQKGKPVTNETVSVTFVRTFSPDQPWVNLQHRAVTDGKGRFEFDHVPPAELQIVTLVPIDTAAGLSRGWTHNPQKVVTVKPGETLTVEIEKKEAALRGFQGFLNPRKTPDKP